jgi:hypothetical protein
LHLNQYIQDYPRLLKLNHGSNCVLIVNVHFFKCLLPFLSCCLIFLIFFLQFFNFFLELSDFLLLLLIKFLSCFDLFLHFLRHLF